MARILLAHRDELPYPVLEVALSERNLIVLLSKLYTPGSKCSFLNGDVPEGFDHAVFRAEPDEVHYASPTRDGGPAGAMHPLAELVYATVRTVVDHALHGDIDGLSTLLDRAADGGAADSKDAGASASPQTKSDESGSGA